MGIEIFNGSTWVSNNDPEIYNGSSFVNIQKGEVYNGSGWNTFYNRFDGTINIPTLTLSSNTVSTITVRVTLPTGSPYKTRVTVGMGLSAFYKPATPAVGAIDQTQSFTGLTANTTYSFYALATYYDATTDEVVGTSETVFKDFSTDAYALTVPTTPTNTSRGQYALNFEATSNANYSTNVSTAYIQFELEAFDIFTGWYYVATEDSSNLPSDDVGGAKQVTFANLTSGLTYRCRARTVYSTVSENSSWSAYSDNVTTKQPVAKNTGLMSGNNTTYLSSSFISATSNITDNPASYASDGNFSSVWISDPVSSTSSASESRTSLQAIRIFGGAQITPGTEFSGSSASTATLTGVTGLRFASSRIWIFGTTNPKTVYIYFTPVIPYTSTFASSVSLSGFTTRGIANGTYTILSVDTPTISGQTYYRVRFSITGATNTGSSTSPTIHTGYMTGNSLSINKPNAVAPSSVQTSPISGNITSITFTDNGSAFGLCDAVGGTLTRNYTAVTYKTSGNETVYLSFRPNSVDYSTPRMTTSNHLRVKNGPGARTITASINGTSLGSLAFASEQTRDFSIPSQINTQYDAYLGGNYFTVTLTVPRVDSGFGWYAQVFETQISYTYTVIE